MSPDHLVLLAGGSLYRKMAFFMVFDPKMSKTVRPCLVTLDLNILGNSMHVLNHMPVWPDHLVSLAGDNLHPKMVVFVFFSEYVMNGSSVYCHFWCKYFKQL